MNEFARGILAALIPALLVAIITAYVTVRLSLGQFYSQKWWEKKAEAYSEIIKQLSDIHYSYQYWIEELEGNYPNLSEQAKNKLQADYENARENLKRLSGVGSYVISDSAATALERIAFVLENAYYGESELEEVSGKAEEVKAAMQTIRSCAAKDLRKE